MGCCSSGRASAGWAATGACVAHVCMRRQAAGVAAVCTRRSCCGAFLGVLRRCLGVVETIMMSVGLTLAASQQARRPASGAATAAPSWWTPYSSQHVILSNNGVLLHAHNCALSVVQSSCCLRCRPGWPCHWLLLQVPCPDATHCAAVICSNAQPDQSPPAVHQPGPLSDC